MDKTGEIEAKIKVMVPTEGPVVNEVLRMIIEWCKRDGYRREVVETGENVIALEVDADTNDELVSVIKDLKDSLPAYTTRSVKIKRGNEK